MIGWMSLAAPMAALLLVVAAVATRPWWGGAGLRGMRRRNANVAAFRSRIDELAQERQAGLLAPEDAQALQDELGARLLAESGAEEAPEPAAAGRRLWPALVLTAALAVFAGGWYVLAGGWQAQRQIAAGRGQDQQVEGMVAKLAERLRQQPDDPTGWGMLGRSYFVLQRFDEAAKAYGEANARSPSPNPEWLAGQGEALGFARDRDLQGTPAQLFDRALAADPKYGKALWYAGLAAAQAGDADKARGYWEKLAADPDLAPQMREVLQARLQEISGAGEAGAAPGGPAGAGASAAAPAAAADGAPAAAAGGTVLNLAISLDPAVAGRAPADAVLFVFAKAASGPPMPLAVQRLPGAHLPLQVRLDDSMAMAPALSLSKFDRYEVTARLSRGGTAQAQSGDLEGSLQLDRAQATGAGQPLALRIDRVIP